MNERGDKILDWPLTNNIVVLYKSKLTFVRNIQATHIHVTLAMVDLSKKIIKWYTSEENVN